MGKERSIPTENTPLMASKLEVAQDDTTTIYNNPPLIKAPPTKPNLPPGTRTSLFLFLEAQTPTGLTYEKFTIFLILLSVLTFILSTWFLPQYNDAPTATNCNEWCDAIWFGNDPHNALESLGLGATSLVEIVIVGIFSIDYLLRVYTADLIHEKYQGFLGRVRFIFSFFSLVDLASTVPFYVDAFVLRDRDIGASNFLRMFRLLRMMKVEGRFDLALGMVDDVFFEQKDVLGTALFVGITVWGVLSSFFYLAERKNPDMIYCGAAPDRCFKNQDDIDTSLCTTNEWGIVDCTLAGCKTKHHGEEEEVCWNLYRSIIDSSFWTLMNLFGEFPLIDQHSAFGKVLGTFTAVVAVAVFALPAGILGSGFEDHIQRRREKKQARESSLVGVEKGNVNENKGGDEVVQVSGDSSTFRGKMYNFLHRQNSPGAEFFDKFINFMVLGTAISFMIDTTNGYITDAMQNFLGWFELASVIIFTIEYTLNIYSIGEDPKHRGMKRMRYAQNFFPFVDALSFVPYWIEVFVMGQLIFPAADKSTFTTSVRFLRLLRLLRFEKYTRAFTTFDDIIRENIDVLTVTGFSALLLWIFFSAILYYTERNNPDEEMANYYKTVPHAMWITLLNLSGECPLAHYSAVGKFIVSMIGLFATAIFGIPIGVLGAGFEEIVTSQNEDTPDKEEAVPTSTTSGDNNNIQQACYRFVNGIGSRAATYFEALIYILIATTVIIGIIQTVPGNENVFSIVEWVAAITFTVEYAIRFIGAGVDPEFVPGDDFGSGVMTRIRFVFSFYSIIDLMAIIPFYLAYAMPGSWVDQHDEYLRMMRLFRLLKLDKYVPSISLVDDVIRLKRHVLLVTCFAAASLWILFSGMMYVAEYKDFSMAIDDLPLYGCNEDCTMSVRYENLFTSMSLVGIHLTGDYPMVEYNSFGRVICFFMVVAAVGVVSIPAGVIASGFSDIVQSKGKIKKLSTENTLGKAGDDWYDIQYRELQGKDAPSSPFGHNMDVLQLNIKQYLDGKLDETTGKIARGKFSKMGRFLFFSLIIANIVAVVLESIPELDRFVGNGHGNFFDRFEAWSVFFFTLDYILRLVSARKSREALYSPWVYATTFFGIVDLISILPWYIQFILVRTGQFKGDEARIFRIVRIFRVLQLEDFIQAFSKLDNVFRASENVLKATGLMAIIIWVGSSALFFLFEKDNPNFRECDPSLPPIGSGDQPGCYDFNSTMACNEYYPGKCSQSAFTNMPNTMFFVAVFLGGDWGFVDFTWHGKLVCLFLCVAGIALYSIPVGTLFDSFGTIIGLSEDDDEDVEEEKYGCS